ncbi:MAG TPA: Dabb family protein [Galbitalea sp.]|jgi:hypothetical protein|nr:Dabb family protein [Galbitalea sp.]
MIRHVLTWKLGAEEAAQKSADFAELAAGFGGLPHLIPAIKSLHIGRDLDETRGNWDVALIIDFATTGDLDIYQQHPEHAKVRDVVRRVTTERTCVDFEL